MASVAVRVVFRLLFAYNGLGTAGNFPLDAGKFQENRTMLTVAVQDSGDGVVLQCRGRIVRGDETAILCAAVRHQRRNVTLDLTGVDAIDAAGIGSLVSLQASGIYLRLLNPTPQVREVLRVTQLESIFEICGSEICEPLVAEETMEGMTAKI
jgi:anti-anti-sigma factor